MTARFAELQYEQLVIHPMNVRKDVGIVTDLANSITEQGILQPLVVAPQSLTPKEVWKSAPSLTPPRFILIAGHRRHAAAALANLDVLPCVIREDLDTEPKQIEAMLVENTHRTDLTVMEEANAFQGLLEFPGYNVKKVARSVGRSQDYVRSRANLTKLPDAAKSALDARLMTLESSKVFDEFEGDEAALAVLEKNAGTKDWHWTVNNLRTRRDREIERAKSEKVLAELKVKTVESPAIYDSSRYERDYDKEKTPEEHVGAGHVAYLNPNNGGLDWYEVKPKTSKPKPTEEEIADKKRLQDIAAGLELAEAQWNEFLENKIRDAAGFNDRPEDKPVVAALREAMFNGYRATYARAARTLGLHVSPAGGVETAEVDAAIGKLKMLQLAYLKASMDVIPNDLHNPKSWHAQYSWETAELEKFLADRTEIFGYEMNPLEQEALDYWAAKNAAAKQTADENEREDEDDE